MNRVANLRHGPSRNGFASAQSSSAKFPGNGWLAPVDAQSILGSLKPSA